MNQSNAGSTEEAGFGAWLGFWAQFIVLGFLAVLGAFFASGDSAPGEYTCGLILSLAAIALAFLRLKHWFDGAAPGWSSFLLVDDMANLIAVIVVFVALALAGLFVAAGFDHGGLHDAGVALFVVSGIAVFITMKHVFDHFSRRR